MADGTKMGPGAVANYAPPGHTEGNYPTAHGAGHRPEFPGASVLTTPRRLPTRRDRWNLWNWRVRTKLFAVLMIPAIAAVVLGSLQVSSELSGVQDLGAIVTQVEVGVKVADLVHEVQRERELMAGFVAFNRGGDRAQLDVQKRRVDGLVTSLQVVGARLQGLDDLGRTSYQQAIAAVGALRTLREVSETTRFSDGAVITSYSAMISALLTLHREVTKATSSRGVGNVGAAADALGRAKEQVAQQHAVLLVASLHNELRPNDVQAVRVADSRYGAALAEFFSVATADVRQLYSDTVTGAEVDLRERIKQGAVQAASAGRSPGINPQEWDVAAGTTADLINKVEAGLNGQLRGTALNLREQAGANAVRDSTILLGSLFATLLLVVVVARSMLMPLRTLRDTAFAVADRRLPEAIRRIRDGDDDASDIGVEPVAVHTREEIGQVARAFDAVHGEAVRLAADQALLRRNVNDMFVNLSRRSQGLVERQLNLIDQLENTEQDPEQLANLFQLDHLATRMRRNSENLLVLAGSELARRSTRPVPAVDVLRAAVSEVEAYQRVTVQTPPAVKVLGRAVNDLVHLIAELLDNATTFSPPETRVVVRSAVAAHGQLVIEILDHGVGMTYEQLVEANQRLEEPPIVDVSVSRRMGLFVVGRLAARHNIVVRLGANEGVHGLTALVTVPADLVQAGELGEYGPATDQVPVPRTGEHGLPVSQPLPVPQSYPVYQQPGPPEQELVPQQPWQDRPDGWGAAADWPAETEVMPRHHDQEPAPYPAQEPAPMQVSMVDAMTGMDLFTPVAVPNLSQDVSPTGDQALREIFGNDYPPAETERRAWPDTDQDAYFGEPAHQYADQTATMATQRPEPAPEDHLGVGGEVHQAYETTPIYEEMVSAWFRELSPPAPAAARPAPTYVEPPPFELPAQPSHQAFQPPAGQQAYRHEMPAQEYARSELARPEPAYRSSAVGSASRHDSGGRGPAGSGRPPVEGGSRPERLTTGGRHEPTPAAPAGGRGGRHAAPADQPPPRYGEPVPYEGEPAHVPAGDQAVDNGDMWRSPADEGWLAVGALTTATNNGFTAAGLPKRRRGAHLVPGAATTAEPAAATPRRARNADDVRGRLANYQQGLRQGREFRRDMAHASLEPGQEPPVQHGMNEESQ